MEHDFNDQLAERWAAEDQNRDLISAELTAALTKSVAELNTRVTAIASWISDLLRRVQDLEESAKHKNES